MIDCAINFFRHASINVLQITLSSAQTASHLRRFANDSQRGETNLTCWRLYLLRQLKPRADFREAAWRPRVTPGFSRANQERKEVFRQLGDIYPAEKTAGDTGTEMGHNQMEAETLSKPRK